MTLFYFVGTRSRNFQSVLFLVFSLDWKRREFFLYRIKIGFVGSRAWIWWSLLDTLPNNGLFLKFETHYIRRCLSYLRWNIIIAGAWRLGIVETFALLLVKRPAWRLLFLKFMFRVVWIRRRKVMSFFCSYFLSTLGGADYPTWVFLHCLIKLWIVISRPWI